ncbi:MAG TPA: hypothetical protein PKB00_13660 [Microthrixaceae bacterium]|nr:hypothetical protein [Microthrixaceae bacterium]
MITQHHLALCGALIVACGEPPTAAPEVHESRLTGIENLHPPPPVAACRAGVAALTGGVAWSTPAQAAAAMGSSGALWLCPGTYDTAMIFPGQGPYLIASVTGDPDDVILEGSNGSQGGVFVFPSRRDVVAKVTGMTFDDRYGGQFGEFVFVVADGSRIEIEDVAIRNMTSRPGFFDYILTMSGISKLTVRRLLIEDSSQHFIFDVSGGGLAGPAEVLIEDYTCRGNREGSSCLDLYAPDAFGVYNGLDATVRRAVMTDNELLEPAIDLLGGAWRLDIEDSLFEGNVIGDLAHGASGGVVEASLWDSRYRDPEGRLTIRRSSFRDNLTADAGSAVTLINNMGDHEWEIAADISDTELLRNTSLNTRDGTTIMPPAYGAVRLTNVDLGTGADNNVPTDVRRCGGGDLGAGTDLLFLGSIRTGASCR